MRAATKKKSNSLNFVDSSSQPKEGGYPMKRQEARNKLIDEFTAALLRISMKIRPITTGPRLSFPNRKFFSGSKTPNHCTPSSTFSVRKKNGAQRARPQNYLIIRQTEPKVDKTKFKHSPLYHTHTHTHTRDTIISISKALNVLHLFH